MHTPPKPVSHTPLKTSNNLKVGLTAIHIPHKVCTFITSLFHTLLWGTNTLLMNLDFKLMQSHKVCKLLTNPFHKLQRNMAFFLSSDAKVLHTRHEVCTLLTSLFHTQL